MGWRGVVRSLEAAQRRDQRARVAHARQSQREATRARAALMQQHAAMMVATELARARYDVEVYENYLALIVSLHKDAWSPWDWHLISLSGPPAPSQEREHGALAALQSYQPSFADRTLGKDHIVRAQLEQALQLARQHDAAYSQQHYAQWGWYRRVGQGVAQGDLAAYVAVIEYLGPFGELEDLGTTVGVKTSAAWYLEATVTVRDAEIVPPQEMKLLASGKVSTKDMPKAKYWALYQDHVCSAAIRVARELLALLPVRTVFVNVGQPAVNSATGHDDLLPLLSVSFDRERFTSLNFDRIDASDAVSTFEHRMKFKKTSGFSAIEVMVPGNSMVSA